MSFLRRWRWPLALLLVLALALGAAVWGLPPLLKQQVETRGSAALGRPVQLARVELSLHRLALTLHGLRVGAEPGAAHAPPQLAVERLHIDLSLRSLWLLAPVVEALEIDRPQLRLARQTDGSLDIDDLVTRLQAPPPPGTAPSEPARFAVFNLQVRGGELTLEDRQVARTHRIQALQMALPFLSNLPEDIPVQVQPRLAFQLADSSVDLSGRSLPFSADRASELALQADGLALEPFWAYLPRALGLLPKGGRLDVNLVLRFAQPPGQTPVLALSGRLGLRDLAADGTRAGTQVALKSLDLALDDVQPLQRRVALGEVAVDGLALALVRDAQGRLAWPGPTPEAAPAAAGRWSAAPAAPAAAASAPAAPPQAESAAGGWQLSLRRLALAGSQLRLADAAVAPAVDWQLQDLAIAIDTLQWPVQAPWPVRAQARLLAGTRPAAALLLEGQASPREVQLQAELTELQLAAAAPYLRAWLQPQLEGQAALKARLDWAGGASPRLQLGIEQARVAPLRLMPVPAARGARPLAQWAALELQGLQVDVTARTVALQRLSLSQPQLALARDAEGALNVQGWLRESPRADLRKEEPGRGTGARTPDAPASSAEAGPPAAPWRAELADLRIDGGRLQWDDAQPRPGVALALEGLRLHAQGLAWPASPRPARFDLAAQLPGEGGPPAKLAARGTLALAPLALRGSVQAERLPLHRFEPYFGAALPVNLARGELGWQGEISASLPAGGAFSALSLDARGQALLADLDLRTPSDAAVLGTGTGDDQLLSWASLQLKPLRVTLAPGAKPRIDIGELVLNDFFSRLVVTEQGRFNLRDVQGEPETAAAVQATAPAAPAASAAAPAPAELPLDLVVGGTRLINGRVDFTDRFIRPSFSAQLTELNGAIGRFASSSPTELATVDLRGRVAGTGRLEVRGALNPTANPLALDIQARTTDLELAPLSPYSGKYAGYAIERGKLSVDLAYKVAPDGALQARNQIVLNQLTFGAAVDSPQATKLPVRLAVALLSDRNGVIDLDLPVSGSINDPQFSIWGIVWKILGNLLSKALTSPFALLSGGGGTDDLSSIAFVPGTARLAEGGAGAIDKIAKALQDRPALRLTLAGHADPLAEKAAVQAAVVNARLQTEQRRDLARAGTPAAAASAALPALSPPDSARLLKRLYTDTPLPGRPRNLIGLLKDVPPAEMRERLEAAVPVTADTARELALQRSLRVRDALIERGLASERLFLGAPKVAAAPAAAASAPAGGAFVPHVELSLAAP
jgi:uncharacterized protein involved in outer membrane biogenesis